MSATAKKIACSPERGCRDIDGVVLEGHPRKAQPFGIYRPQAISFDCRSDGKMLMPAYESLYFPAFFDAGYS